MLNRTKRKVICLPKHSHFYQPLAVKYRKEGISKIGGNDEELGVLTSEKVLNIFKKE